MPYFYFQAPPGLNESHLPALKQALSKDIGENNVIKSLDIVLKQSLYGYRGDAKSPFVKITVNDPRSFSKIRQKIEQGVTIPYYERAIRNDTTYESNLAYLLRFMIDCKVTGSNWIELPPGTYTVTSNPTSHAQIEVSTT